MSKRRGNCYVTVEALYHLLGGKASGWKSYSMKHEGDTHWWLEKHGLDSHYANSDGKVVLSIPGDLLCRLDPTVSQFKNLPDYSKGRGRGFLTKRPSKRARILMDLMVWQKGKD